MGKLKASSSVAVRSDETQSSLLFHILGYIPLPHYEDISVYISAAEDALWEVKIKQNLPLLQMSGPRCP